MKYKYSAMASLNIKLIFRLTTISKYNRKKKYKIENNTNKKEKEKDRGQKTISNKIKAGEAGNYLIKIHFYIVKKLISKL